MKPEEKARQQIDDQLEAAGWTVQSREAVNLGAARGVVAPDQIRTVIRTFRDRLSDEIFPGRSEVPKTLVFAKNDSHAEDIVRIVREEFGKGNKFCQKVTYVWTTEALWRAYAQLERDKVRGMGAKRALTDLVSLVRHAV